MKQVANSPFLGIVSDKKWSPFLDLGVRGPIFLHLAENGCFRVKKSKSTYDTTRNNSTGTEKKVRG